jgi:hypothetical protein
MKNTLAYHTKVRVTAKKGFVGLGFDGKSESE